MDNFKIGIVVHSQTGNTLSVGERIKRQIESTGRTAALERIYVEGLEKNPQLVKNAELPDIKKFDLLVLGAPVWAFSLSPAMTELLKETDSLKDKKLLLFLTQSFPFKWMGGNRALKQLVSLCTAKGGKVAETGIVNWTSKNREETIAEIAERFGKSV